MANVFHPSVVEVGNGVEQLTFHAVYFCHTRMKTQTF
jgi:hypothetical protein